MLVRTLELGGPSGVFCGQAGWQRPSNERSGVAVRATGEAVTALRMSLKARAV